MNAARGTVPDAVAGFLRAPTPRAWVHAAAGRLGELLNDHANCEHKAASAALATMHRYPSDDALVQRMSRLAREELRHYEQVRALMRAQSIGWQPVAASRYAHSLRAACRSEEPGRRIDTLIVGALIEARSCERFARLIGVLPEAVARLYASLLRSEARHFEVYLELARTAGEIGTRIDTLATLEAQLATAPDDSFAFHSGPPRSP